jgi:beta-mannosidase
MRRWFVLPLIALAAPALASPKTVVPLDGAWQVRIDPTDTAATAAHKREAKWLTATVPGSACLIRSRAPTRRRSSGPG